jgi:hypothetical protein
MGVRKSAIRVRHARVRKETAEDDQPIPELSVGTTVDHTTPDGVYQWILGNVHTLDAVGGIKPFPDYPFVKRMVEAMIEHRILIVAKSRQMMATWTAAAFILHQCLFANPGIYLLMSKGQRDSKELVKRLKTMIENLPEELRDQVTVKAGEIEFGSGSRMIALPATESAPRMHSPSGVFWDEMAFTPKSEETWTAVKPAIDSGGSFVGVSTPNGMDNVFYRLFNDPSNGFGKVTLHWSDHPGRDEIWSEKAKRGLSQAKWRQEYEVDFNTLADRVFDEFDHKRHVLPEKFEVSQNPGKVYRGIDFGYRHPYAVWIHQAENGDLTLFDEWEGANATVQEIAKVLRRVDARHGISEETVQFTGCDPAGAAIADEGVSVTERLERQGVKLVWKASRIAGGIDLIKSLLVDANGVVTLKFDPGVTRTIHHLTHYRWEGEGKRPRKDDGHDHACDALRYLLINLYSKRSVAWSGGKVMGVGR